MLLNNKRTRNTKPQREEEKTIERRGKKRKRQKEREKKEREREINCPFHKERLKRTW